MTIIKDTYFKLTHDEHTTLISGLALPDPDRGPYNFHDCTFHPRVWAAWRQLYACRGSVLTGTSYAGPTIESSSPASASYERCCDPGQITCE